MGQRGKLRALAGICHVDPRKLFLIQRKSRFSAKVCFPRRPHAVFPRSQVPRDTSSIITFFSFFCFSFKHQTEVGLHADVSEERLPLKQRLPLV